MNSPTRGLAKIAESKGASQAVIREVEEQYWNKYAPKVFGGLLGVVGVAAIIKGLSKAHDSYWRISETSDLGTRSIVGIGDGTPSRGIARE